MQRWRPAFGLFVTAATIAGAADRAPAEPQPASAPAAEAAARDWRTLAQQAAEALAAGNYAAAARAFRAAAEQQPDRPELTYNEAVARYRLGEYADAADLFQQTGAGGDRRLDTRARFNQANCLYAQALRASGDPAADRRAALESLNRAITLYREVIAVDPTDLDARANVELAYRLREELEKQPPQSQPSSQPQSPPASQPQESPQSQPSSQPGGEGSASQPSPQEQQSAATQPQDAAASQPQPDEQRQAATQPSPPASQPDEGEGELNSRADEEPVESQPAEGAAVRRLTREEAERLLQLIRDKERQRREMLARQEAQRQRDEPVSRDW